MAYSFVLHVLRSFVAMSLVLQAQPAFRSSALCPETHCIYLPLTSNPQVVTINSAQIHAHDNKGLIRYAFGDVINSGYLPIYNVVVQATFYYYEGTGYTNSVTTTTFLTATLPGQLNTFEVNSLSRSAVLSDAQVLSWDITPTLPLANLTVVESHASLVLSPIAVDPTGPDQATFITGTLRNDTSSKLKNIHVYVWNIAYGLSGGLVISQVSVGETVAFSGTFSDPLLYAGTPPPNPIHIVAQGVTAITKSVDKK